MTGARNRAALAKNLFRTDAAARVLVAVAGVQPGERVYDLGAGTGRVTYALVAAGASVIAVERDTNLAGKLRARFSDAPVSVVCADLRRVPFKPPFKVVANLPFNVTAATLQRLLFDRPAPDSATLVLQREVAAKYAGRPRPTAVSLAARPWFEIRLRGGFERRDFVPAPSVDAAILRIDRRPEPLLNAADRSLWRSFVRYALARPSNEARATFRPLLSGLQWRRLSADLQIASDAKREDLDLDQWLGLYQFIRCQIPARKRRRALGA